MRPAVTQDSNTPGWTELAWQDGGQQRRAWWRNESARAAPRKLQAVDDRLGADAAHRLASEGWDLVWRGDFQNARHLLDALTRRLERKPRAASRTGAAASPAFPQAFHLYRQAQAQRARILSSVLIELDGAWRCPLRRAPDWSEACRHAWGAPAAGEAATVLVPLRELIGALGAHEWRKKGVAIEALGGRRIHSHYGVFSPVRGEYLDLVAQAPLPAVAAQGARDLGVGTGVLTAILLERGVPTVHATDLSERALACAAENLRQLGLAPRVRLLKADLFAEGKAGLIVCNPPWLPGKATTWLEQAVYDDDSRMLKGFLAGLAAHLLPGGEGWLILSDLAEHLQLRPREQLLKWIEDAGLVVAGRLDTRPRHGKAADRSDALHAARSKEVTSLWRLRAA